MGLSVKCNALIRYPVHSLKQAGAYRYLCRKQLRQQKRHHQNVSRQKSDALHTAMGDMPYGISLKESRRLRGVL